MCGVDVLGFRFHIGLWQRKRQHTTVGKSSNCFRPKVTRKITHTRGHEIRPLLQIRKLREVEKKKREEGRNIKQEQKRAQEERKKEKRRTKTGEKTS